ncbi:MAG TPA: enoyl-CoA hydratase-related protein [Solirubrobacteraceae bacterium]|jgi:enoyl-CoA hydratase/3-hydroxyacyl-CoA dehydrogenase|nr:enoyl-CoA hydratase-related protein [Solirubrobacteraceae bacterium]
MFVFKAAVVGAGTMGGQIAQTIAAAGIPVVLKDVNEELVQAGIEEARKVSEGQVARLVKKGKLSEQEAAAQVQEIVDRIEGAVSYESFGDVDFVVEAVPERMEIKQQVFAELDAATPGHAVLASNTSSLSITDMGEATMRPEKVVGFHYFYPASLMPLIEIVEGQDTSSETLATAVAFAQAIRKQPIVCAEVPGFVVNRILTSGMSEIWRAQEQDGLSIKAIDEGVGAAGVVPMGPYFLINLLGLDTVLHVAQHMAESYGGDRFFVPRCMRELVAERRLGAKTGGDGFYGPEGQPNVAGEADPDVQELVEMLSLKTLSEACMVLEEGVATHRDIDFGMMAGAGLDPRRGLMPPFMKADAEGLDVVLKRMEQAQERHGERFAPPRILQRLVAQGRLGAKSGQGFYAYAQLDEAQPAETVKIETREYGIAIAWLANGQMNSISPQVVKDLRAVWEQVRASEVRSLILASSNPFLFCSGADIKAFTQMDEQAGADLLEGMHGLLREMERSSVTTIAAVNGLAYGGGCEIAMACDFRIAARSAIFGQPEIKLGIIPGFGGTQRLPRLVGEAQALEMNLTGEPVLAQEAYELGLATRVVDDHELLDTALMWARKLAGQAPLAVQQIKSVSAAGDLDQGIEAEKRAFGAAFASEDAREGISAFLGKRQAKFSGR